MKRAANFLCWHKTIEKEKPFLSFGVFKGYLTGGLKISIFGYTSNLSGDYGAGNGFGGAPKTDADRKGESLPSGAAGFLRNANGSASIQAIIAQNNGLPLFQASATILTPVFCLRANQRNCFFASRVFV